MAEYMSREDYCEETCGKENREGYKTCKNCSMLNVPTADVQPVKHGRWLPSDSCITAAYGTIHCQICSECGADLMEDNDYDYDFCPVCGTRMDLKDGETG